MMGLKIIIPIVLLGLIASVSLFKVEQWESAMVFKFREIQSSDYKPGLHVKIPIVNEIQKFEKRLLNLDEEPQHFFTIKKKEVNVDYYVKWRISDVEVFYRATQGNVGSANVLLAQKINSALRDEFGTRTIEEVVAGERSDIMKIVTDKTVDLPAELGIDVVDVRVKRIDLPETVSDAVYARMRSERERVAKEHRARGREAAERIEANADREREIILANAYRDAEIVRGEGDAQATETYAAAYNKDKEFYALYRSLLAYQNSFNGQNDILLISPASDFFKYFNHPQGR